MEVYILDSLNRRVDVADKFESLIWTERMAAFGDFKFRVPSSLQNRTRFIPGVRLAINGSYRLMTIETVEDVTDDQDRRLLEISGYSLEKILDERLAAPELGAIAKWSITDFPADIARYLFNYICVLGTLDPGDIIAGVVEGNVLFPPDTIPEPDTAIEYIIDPMSLYQAIKNLCDAYGMGFRLVKDPLTSTLYFDVYMGADRTTAQTDLPAVVFSPDMDNLSSTKQLTTTALYRNAAYVLSAVGSEIVYPDDVDPDVEGFERRVLWVVASDIDDPDGPTASAQMIQRGKQALAQARKYMGLDGELTSTSQYVYGTHYNLGDLVEIRNSDGLGTYVQVTEQIFTKDAEGERSFPTLSVNELVYPGSWSSISPAIVWDDYTTEEWDDLP